jgi:hypothetical protein
MIEHSEEVNDEPTRMASDPEGGDELSLDKLAEREDAHKIVSDLCATTLLRLEENLEKSEVFHKVGDERARLAVEELFADKEASYCQHMHSVMMTRECASNSQFAFRTGETSGFVAACCRRDNELVGSIITVDGSMIHRTCNFGFTFVKIKLNEESGEYNVTYFNPSEISDVLPCGCTYGELSVYAAKEIFDFLLPVGEPYPKDLPDEVGINAAMIRNFSESLDALKKLRRMLFNKTNSKESSCCC